MIFPLKHLKTSISIGDFPLPRLSEGNHFHWDWRNKHRQPIYVTLNQQDLAFAYLPTNDLVVVYHRYSKYTYGYDSWLLELGQCVSENFNDSLLTSCGSQDIPRQIVPWSCAVRTCFSCWLNMLLDPPSTFGKMWQWAVPMIFGRFPVLRAVTTEGRVFFPANPPMFELILAAMKETLVSIKHDSHMAAEKNTRLWIMKGR